MADFPATAEEVSDNIGCSSEDETLEFNFCPFDEYTDATDEFEHIEEDKLALAAEIENAVALEEAQAFVKYNELFPQNINCVPSSGISFDPMLTNFCPASPAFIDSQWKTMNNGYPLANGNYCNPNSNMNPSGQNIKPPNFPHQIHGVQLDSNGIPFNHSNQFFNFQPSHNVAQQIHHKKSQPHTHIKKPLNAFMLYMRDVRPEVLRQAPHKDSTTINQMIGKMWQALNKDEQNRYFDKAREERENHKRKYPEYNPRDYYAYGVKRRRRKRDKNGNEPLPKKCRARFGLEHQEKWCKHCKRKKKCLRYLQENGLPQPEFPESNEIGPSDTLQIRFEPKQ